MFILELERCAARFLIPNSYASFGKKFINYLRNSYEI